MFLRNVISLYLVLSDFFSCDVCLLSNPIENKDANIHRISAKNYLKSLKFNPPPPPTDTGHFHSHYNQQKWLSC